MRKVNKQDATITIKYIFNYIGMVFNLYFSKVKMLNHFFLKTKMDIQYRENGIGIRNKGRNTELNNI